MTLGGQAWMENEAAQAPWDPQAPPGHPQIKATLETLASPEFLALKGPRETKEFLVSLASLES